MFVSALVAEACVISYYRNCPSFTGNCPNGESTSAECTSEDIEHLNQDVGNDSGYDPVPASAACSYSCKYTDFNGVLVYCGDTNKTYSVYIPGQTQCPHTSGSGS